MAGEVSKGPRPFAGLGATPRTTSAPAPTGTAAPVPRHMGTGDWGLLVLHSLLWGSAFFFVDIAKADVPLFTINALRLVPASLILLAVLWLSGQALRPLLPHWRLMLLLGIFNNTLPFSLLIFGQGSVTGGIAAIFIATTPMFGLLFQRIAAPAEPIRANALVGMALGVAGVALLASGPQSAGGVLAMAALAMAAACYAFAGVLTRTLRHLPPTTLATGQMVVSLAIAAPFALIIDPWSALGEARAISIAATLATGVFASALAAMCFFTLLARAGAANALLVTILLPIWPMLFGATLLSQTVRTSDILGAAVIAIALVVIDGRALTFAAATIGARRHSRTGPQP